MARRRGIPRTALAWVVVLLVVAVYAVRVARVTRRADAATLVGLAVVAGIAVVLLVAYAVSVKRRIRRQVAHVAARRPGAEVVAGRATDQHTAQARRLGVGTRNLPPDGKDWEYVVAAILPDRVELWVRDDDRPRWAVSRRGASTMTARARTRYRAHDALTVSDGSGEVLLVPVAETFGRAARRRAYERAARALGVDGQGGPVRGRAPAP